MSLPEADRFETQPSQGRDCTIPACLLSHLLYQMNQRAQPSLTFHSLAALFTDSALAHESFLLYNQSRHTSYSSKCFLVCLKCNYIHISNTLTHVPFDIIQNRKKKSLFGSAQEQMWHLEYRQLYVNAKCMELQRSVKKFAICQLG